MNVDEYKTKDLGEAAALYTSGIKLLRLDNELDFFWFIFEKRKAVEVSDLYWSGILKVRAKEYNECTRSLKERLFAIKSKHL